MASKDIIEQALTLTPTERLLVVEGLLQSLDRPVTHIENIWLDEAETRLKAYHEGSLRTVPAESVFPGLDEN